MKKFLLCRTEIKLEMKFARIVGYIFWKPKLKINTEFMIITPSNMILKLMNPNN